MPPQENYRMPEPYDVCRWAPTGQMDWSPAFVTKTNRGTISVVVFSVDARMGVPKDGVRHLSDPSAWQISPDEGGVWDFTGDQKVLRELMGIKDDEAPAPQGRRKKAEVA